MLGNIAACPDHEQPTRRPPSRWPSCPADPARSPPPSRWSATAGRSWSSARSRSATTGSPRSSAAPALLVTGSPRGCATSSTRACSSAGPTRATRFEYHLTDSGRELVPVLDGCYAWGGGTPSHPTTPTDTAHAPCDAWTRRPDDQHSPTPTGDPQESRTVTWHDPAKPAAAGTLRWPASTTCDAMVAGDIPPPPIAQLLQFDLAEAEPGRVVVHVHARRVGVQPDRRGPRRPGVHPARLGGRLRAAQHAARRARATPRSRSRSATSRRCGASSGRLTAVGTRRQGRLAGRASPRASSPTRPGRRSRPRPARCWSSTCRARPGARSRRGGSGMMKPPQSVTRG